MLYRIHIYKHKRRYKLVFVKEAEDLKHEFKQRGGIWDKEDNLWGWVVDAETLGDIGQLFRQRVEYTWVWADTEAQKIFHKQWSAIKEERLVELTKKLEREEFYASRVRLKEQLARDVDTLRLPDSLKRDVIKPYNHQVIAAHFGLSVGSVLFAHEMGLGKTLTAIMLCELADYKEVLVVAPNSLVLNFYREVFKFTTTRARMIRNTKTRHQEPEENSGPLRYTVVNYEYFNTKPEKFIASGKLEKLGIKLTKKNPQLAVIFDEAHRLKNPSANTTKNIFKHIIPCTKVRIPLTGTPAPNRIAELFSLLHMLRPDDFKSKTQFFKEYCSMVNTDYGWQASGVQPKFEAIKNALDPVWHRCLKEEVLKDLPEKTTIRIPLELSEAEWKQYEEIEEGVAVELFEQEKSSTTHQLTILLRLRQYLAERKMHHMKDTFEELIEESTKFVVFDQFKASTQQLHRWFEEFSVRHDGDCSPEERDHAVQTFQKMAYKPMFIGTIDTCKEGITLTAGSIMYVLTQPYTPGVQDQLSDRQHRIGQPNACMVYMPYFVDTLDERVWKLVQGKKSQLAKVGLSKEPSNDLPQETDDQLNKEFLQNYRFELAKKYGKKKKELETSKV